MEVSKTEFKDLIDLADYACRCSLRSWELYLEITSRGEYRTENILPLRQVKPETYSYQAGFTLKSGYISELSKLQTLIETLFGDQSGALVNQIAHGVLCLLRHNPLFLEGNEYLSSDIIKAKKKQLSAFKSGYKKIKEINKEIKSLRDDPTYSLLLGMTNSSSLAMLEEKSSKIRVSPPRRKGTPDIIEVIDQITLELKRIEAKSLEGKCLDNGLAWILHVFSKRLKVKQFNVKPSQVKWLFSDEGMRLAIKETKTTRATSVMSTCLAYQVACLFLEGNELTYGKIINAKKSFPFKASEAEINFIRECKAYDTESVKSWRIVESLGNKRVRLCTDTVDEMREKVFSHLRSNQQITIHDLASLRREHKMIIKRNQLRLRSAQSGLMNSDAENKTGLSLISLGSPHFLGDEFTKIKTSQI